MLLVNWEISREKFLGNIFTTHNTHTQTNNEINRFNILDDNFFLPLSACCAFYFSFFISLSLCQWQKMDRFFLLLLLLLLDGFTLYNSHYYWMMIVRICDLNLIHFDHYPHRFHNNKHRMVYIIEMKQITVISLFLSTIYLYRKKRSIY